MNFFTLRAKINPLFIFITTIFLVIFGLFMAKERKYSYFLLGCFIWFMLFGCRKKCLKVIPSFLLVGGSFGFISYLVYQNFDLGIAMFNRFGSIFLAAALGLSVEPVDLVRNLSALKVSRGLTLGIIIATSFPFVLKTEIKRVREAMKTRGSGSLFIPKIFYRAFLVPLVTRIVNISDTLSLSIETRGFSLKKRDFTVYKKEIICLSDLIFVIVIGLGAIFLVTL